jgi:biotin synthase
LKDLGFQVGSGSLVGLPEQTLEDIADDIMFCVDLDLDMATFSPFIPHPQTPLANERGGTWQLGLRVLATARIALPAVHIPCSTALATVTPEDYVRPLKAGANIVMADVTPFEFVQYYDLYPGKAPTGFRKGRDAVKRLKKIIESIGRPIGDGRGDSFRHPVQKLFKYSP